MVGEVLRGSQEPEFLLQRRKPGLATRAGLVFQGLLENVADPGDVDEINRQGAETGSLGPLPAVMFRQAQEFLHLSQPAPGELPFEQLVGKITDRRANLPGFPAIVISELLICTEDQVGLISCSGAPTRP
jgi:hypothetical protein